MSIFNRKYKDSVFTDRLSDAFYTKDNSKLELVVKVKNCTNPELLPILKSCDILKQYFC